MTTVARAMLAVAAALGAMTLVYGLASGEEAGTVMLLLAAGLALIVGGYLVTGGRDGAAGGESEGEAAGESEDATADLYLPHASVWPFWIGLGCVIVGNGLALGLWGLIPGAAVILIGVTGFARQSRFRD